MPPGSRIPFMANALGFTLACLQSWAIIWSTMLIQISLLTLPMRLVRGSSPSFKLVWAPILTKVGICCGADLPAHLRQSRDLHNGQCIGAHVQIVLPTIYGKDSSSNLIPGRLNIPVVVTLLVNDPSIICISIISMEHDHHIQPTSLQYHY